MNAHALEGDRNTHRVVLADLVARITPENRHDEEIDSTVGNEA